MKVFKINKLEIPVIYDNVDKSVENIWKTNPALVRNSTKVSKNTVLFLSNQVIHCGVHGTTDKLLLECGSKSFGYCGVDYSGCCLASPDVCLKNNTCSELSTNLPVQEIFHELNAKYHPNSFLEVSCDPGKYAWLLSDHNLIY
jgi:hypothetical protein